ncbi:hypothetical protein SUDANB121_05709 [Nocardiopsis dassonvillei]|uniref:hypothetical protein n=1 Tax=Nocardiopsis dassonvillei TaxID=2014 RepID=UPI003F57204E
MVRHRSAADGSATGRTGAGGCPARARAASRTGASVRVPGPEGRTDALVHLVPVGGDQVEHRTQAADRLDVVAAGQFGPQQRHPGQGAPGHLGHAQARGAVQRREDGGGRAFAQQDTGADGPRVGHRRPFPPARS